MCPATLATSRTDDKFHIPVGSPSPRSLPLVHIRPRWESLGPCPWFTFADICNYQTSPRHPQHESSAKVPVSTGPSSAVRFPTFYLLPYFSRDSFRYQRIPRHANPNNHAQSSGRLLKDFNVQIVQIQGIAPLLTMLQHNYTLEIHKKRMTRSTRDQEIVNTWASH